MNRASLFSSRRADRLAYDVARTRQRARAAFQASRKAEKQFGQQLRRIADHIAQIIRDTQDGSMQAAVEIGRWMARYSEMLDPWARSVATRMHAEIDARDTQQWEDYAARFGVELRRQMIETPVGSQIRALMDDQVGLIKSLPLEAAKRVHEMAIDGHGKGQRPDAIMQEILATGEVTKSRARLIARTEVARTASVFNEVRARNLGCTHFVWRTVGDASVRQTHRALAGKVFAYDDPPECDPGHRALPGQIWNCFPGSTKVALTNGCHELWRYWHEGQMVVIKHEAGLLEATPNHPILTRRGWRAAKDIEAGDDLIQSSLDRRLALADDENEGIPSFSDLFTALDSCLDRESHIGLLFDFHGDRPDHHVDAIWSEAVLSGYNMPLSFERLRNLNLARANRRMGQAIIGGGLHIGETRGAGSFGDLAAIVVGHRAHPANHILRATASLGAVGLEDSRDNVARTLELERKAQLRLAPDISINDFAFRKIIASVGRRAIAAPDRDTAGAETLAHKIRVEADRRGSVLDGGSGHYKTLGVVEKSFRQFAGHVFTMESFNGWFSVSEHAVIAKNCRCWAEPILPSLD